jgi:flagellar biosynthesis/type III secretory pathway protein FliH
VAQISEKKKGREREKKEGRKVGRKEGRKKGRKEGESLVPWNNLVYILVLVFICFAY